MFTKGKDTSSAHKVLHKLWKPLRDVYIVFVALDLVSENKALGSFKEEREKENDEISDPAIWELVQHFCKISLQILGMKNCGWGKKDSPPPPITTNPISQHICVS